MGKTVLLLLVLSVTVCLTFGAVGWDHPLVIWTQRSHRWSKVRGLSLESRNWTTLQTMKYVQSQGVWDTYKYSISYNYLQDELLWSDIQAGQLYRQTLNHTLNGRQDTLTPVFSPTHGPVMVNGIASDWLTGAVYFTESRTGWVGVLGATSKTGNYKVLYSSQEVNEPHDLAVDPVEGVLFWTETLVARIMAAPTSGGQARPLLTSDLDSPLGLTVDAGAKKLYWADRGRGRVESMGYDGSARDVIFQQPDGDLLFSVTVVDDLLFVTTEESLHLHVVNIRTKRVEHSFDVDAYAYDIISTARPPQTDRPHECVSLSCEHICLNHGLYSGSCVCRDDYFINADGRTCSAATKPRFIYSTGSTISSVNVTLDSSTQLISRSPAETLVTGASGARALAVHVAGELLYFASADDRAVHWELLGNAEAEWRTHSEITVQTGDVQGLAVDWLSDTLYWSDSGLEHIMVSYMDGRYHCILLDGLSKPPRGLAVHPLAGLLFWVTDSGLQRLRFDGMKQGSVLDGLFMGQSVAVDSRTNRVYVTDTAASEIHITDVDGQRHDILDMRSTGMYGITVFQDMLTWTKDGLGLQYSPADDASVYALSNGSSYPRTRQAEVTHYYDVVTYGDYLQPVTQALSACQSMNGGCSQLCFPSAGGGRTCGCAVGYTLHEDGGSCTVGSPPGGFLLFVDPYHKQLYQVSAYGASSPIYAVPTSTLPSYPVSVDYSPSDGKLYWIDQGLRAVVESSMEAGGEETLLWSFGEASHPQKLIASPGKLYIMDVGESRIMRLHTDGTEPRVDVAVDNIQELRALEVDVENGVLYWSTRTAEGRSLVERMNEDGTDRELILDNMGDITDLDLSLNDSLLYFCDGEKGYLGYINVNASSPTNKILVESVGTMFNGIAVNQNGDVYFSAWNDKGIRRININEAEMVVERVMDPVFARIMDMKFFDYRYAAPVIDDEPNSLLIPILIGVGLFLLLGLLIFGLLYGLRRCRNKHSSKDTTSSNEPIQDLDNEVEWMDFENPSLFDMPESQPSPPPGVAPVNPQDNTERPPPKYVTRIVNGSIVAGNQNDHITVIPATTTSSGNMNGEEVNRGSVHSGQESRTESLISSGAMATPLAIVGPKKSGRFKKHSNKKPAQRLPSAQENHSFDLSESQKVATVLQRIVGRMRNKLSSVKWKESNPRPPVDPPSTRWTDRGNFDQQPPDITMNMPIGSSNSSLASEKGLKVLPGSRYVYMPPKLHDPPRGWAPASHNVPMGGIKSSWGKAKTQQMLEKQPQEQDNANKD